MSADAKSNSRPNRKEFKRVRNEPAEKGNSKENEVRIVASRGQRMYIKYAIDILTGAEGKQKHDSVILSGMGNAVYNVVNIAEILKRRVKGLHQITTISSQTLTDKYEAVKEGAEGLEIERKVSVIEIVLSTAQLDTKNPGYQAPLPESEVTEQDERVVEKRERRPRADGDKEGSGRGRGRGGRGGRSGSEEGRGRGGRGGSRGGDRRDDRDDRAPRGGRGGRGGDRDRDDRPRRGGSGGRGGRDDRDDRAPSRGGRGGSRGGRDDRDDRAPRGGRGGRGGDRDRDDRPRRGGRDERPASTGGRGGRGGDRDRDDRAPSRGRGGSRGGDRRDDRPSTAPSRGGRGGYSEGRSERGGRDRR